MSEVTPPQPLPAAPKETTETSSFYSHITRFAFDALQERDATISVTKNQTTGAWSGGRDGGEGRLYNLGKEDPNVMKFLRDPYAMRLLVDREKQTVTAVGSIESQAGRRNGVGFEFVFDAAQPMEDFVSSMEQRGTSTLVDTLNYLDKQSRPQGKQDFVRKGVLNKKDLATGGTSILDTSPNSTIISGPVLIMKMQIEDGTSVRTVDFSSQEKALAK